MQNLNTLFNLVKQAAPVTVDPHTQDSTSTLHYNNPLGPGFWKSKYPNIWDEFLKHNDPLGPGLWQPKQPDSQSNPWGINPDWTKTGPGRPIESEKDPWEWLKGPWGPSEGKENPWERNKDQDKYYDEFWKWYNKDGLWTYRPGSDPMWEDETWRKHKKEFIDYYNNQNQPATQPAAQPAPAPQPTSQQSSTHIVGPVIGKTTYNPADIINK